MLLTLLLQNPTEKLPERGIIAGNLLPSADGLPSGSVQIILLSPEYTNVWGSDAQKRLDLYWERYKQAFAQRKEFFFEVSAMARRETLGYVINRMQRDPRIRIEDFVRTMNSDGKFEFKDLPLGEYRIVAFGKVGAEDEFWEGSVEVVNSVPQFVRLKKVIP